MGRGNVLVRGTAFFLREGGRKSDSLSESGAVIRRFFCAGAACGRGGGVGFNEEVEVNHGKVRGMECRDGWIEGIAECPW